MRSTSCARRSVRLRDDLVAARGERDGQRLAWRLADWDVDIDSAEARVGEPPVSYPLNRGIELRARSEPHDVRLVLGLDDGTWDVRLGGSGRIRPGRAGAGWEHVPVPDHERKAGRNDHGKPGTRVDSGGSGTRTPDRLAGCGVPAALPCLARFVSVPVAIFEPHSAMFGVWRARVNKGPGDCG